MKIAEKALEVLITLKRDVHFDWDSWPQVILPETSVLRAENISIFFFGFQKIPLVLDTVSDYPSDKQVLIHVSPGTNCLE